MTANTRAHAELPMLLGRKRLWWQEGTAWGEEQKFSGKSKKNLP